MKKWRKILLVGLAAVAASAICAVFAACSGQSGIENYFVVDEGNTITVSGEKGASVEFPEVAKEGYIFKGWYLDKDGFGMPVSSATFEESVTYYAVWAKGYEVTLDLDGGTLDLTSKIYLEEGATIASYMQTYVPSNGDYPFGGWFVGDEPLEPNAKMTTAGITLTARYQAAYTVDVYLQDIDDAAQYTKQAAYATGYALIGEEFAPTVSVKGFTMNRNDGETELVISKTVSQNRFELYFDRNEYTLTLAANYPDGTFASESESYLFGESFNLPENNFAIQGYRFLGWSTSANAAYADVIKETTYALEGDTVFYAVWNKGYTDMFGGADYIFLDYEREGAAVLCRGGVDIEGAYNDIKEIWEFKGDGITISAKLKDDGTFIWYGNRNATYYLVVGNLMYQETTLYLGDLDECEYTSRAEGATFSKQGTYSVDENGVYVATLTDVITQEVSTLYFLVGQATVSSTGTVYNIFRIRGDEYSYGEMGLYRQGNIYYPTITLDGWGKATLKSSSSGTASGTYTISDDIVTLTFNNQSSVLRIRNVSGNYIYEYYNSTFDRTFVNGEATLTLNGCSTAVYVNGATTVTGAYTVEESYFGGYIVRVTAGENGYVFIVNVDASSGTAEYVFTEKSAEYAEYRYLDEEGALKASILVINGDGTAALYEVKDQELAETASGDFVKEGNAYVFTATTAIADWAQYKFRTMKVMFTTVATTSSEYFDVYYLLSAQVEGEEVIDYITVYTGENGATLTLTKLFAIYELEGKMLSGMYADFDDYIRVIINNQYFSFVLNKGETNTFTEIKTPVVCTLMSGTEADDSVTLTLMGASSAGENSFIAVYTEKTEEQTDKYKGTYTENKIEQFGLTRYVYTFVSDDGSRSFKFTIATNTNTGAYYFYRYAADENVSLVTITMLTEGSEEDKNTTLVLTDAGISYTADGNTVTGTIASETYFAFDLYESLVYTFTPATGTAFRFTLLTNSKGAIYFRGSGEDQRYTAADGSTIAIDGLTHVAQYTDAAGTTYEGLCWTAANLVDSEDIALTMAVDGVNRYFDLNSAENTFALRGTEAVTNIIVMKNGMIQNMKLSLNGHGKATALEGDETEDGTYVVQNGVVTVTMTADGTTYVGDLGYISLLGYRIPVFFIEIEGVSGTYLNEKDLSVFVLNAIGTAVKYDSYGTAEAGSYTMLDSGLFYYQNNAGTDAAVYTYTSGKVVKQTYKETFYAADFASIVFTAEGTASFDGTSCYYRYDADSDKIYTYSTKEAEGKSANSYGLYVSEYAITDEKIGYNGKTYFWFDTYAVTLTDAAGNTLRFAPDGEASFSVDAIYTDTNDQITEYKFVVDNQKGVVTVYLACNRSETFGGGALKYSFLYNYTAVTVDFEKKTFTFDDTEFVCAYTSYDYSYLSTGKESNFGMIYIFGETKDGNVEYTVSGRFNYLTDENGKAVTFSDGIISKAGYLNQNYGNLYIIEFTGSDGNVYHLSFYLVTVRGVPCFLTYAFTRVTGSVDLGEGTIVYQEELVLTLFNFDQATGDEFYPTLKYKGELICSHSWKLNEEQNQWMFASLDYGAAAFYYYYFDFTADEQGKFTGGTVVQHSSESYKTADEAYTVYVEYDVATGEYIEILGIVPNGGTAENVKECVKNEDGSFTVTTASGTYTVTFGTSEDEEGNVQVTVTVVKVEESGGEAGGDQGSDQP